MVKAQSKIVYGLLALAVVVSVVPSSVAAYGKLPGEEDGVQAPRGAKPSYGNLPGEEDGVQAPRGAKPSYGNLPGEEDGVQAPRAGASAETMSAAGVAGFAAGVAGVESKVASFLKRKASKTDWCTSWDQPGCDPRSPGLPGADSPQAP